MENKVGSPVGKKRGKRIFTFYLTIIQKNSPQHWIVKDGVFCISYWQAGLGIVQFCNIVLSLVSSIGILGIWRSVLKIHFFIELGLKCIQFKIQFKTKFRIFIQKNINSIEPRIFNRIIRSKNFREIIQIPIKSSDF